MNKHSLTIAEAISKVQEGFGSVYTKEDVMILLEAIKPQSLSRSQILSDLKDRIVDRIADNLDNDIIDYDSAQFNISYGNTLELEQVDFDSRAMYNYIDNQLDILIDDITAEEEEQVSDDVERNYPPVIEANEPQD